MMTEPTEPVDPYSRFDEGQMAIETLEKFLAEKAAEKSLVIDFTAPENMGGGWLQPIRDAAEKLRQAARRAARRKKPKK